jgi:hypothetical protein
MHRLQSHGRGRQHAARRSQLRQGIFDQGRRYCPLKNGLRVAAQARPPRLWPSRKRPVFESVTTENVVGDIATGHNFHSGPQFRVGRNALISARGRTMNGEDRQ